MAGSKSGKPEKRSVRLVKRGDVVRLPDGSEEVVRDFQVVLQMANGSNLQFSGTDILEVSPPEELPELT